MRLPAEGRTFFTWDPVLRRSPNRAWRRWGTDRLVRVRARASRASTTPPTRARRGMAVGDLSRPHGGDFGPQFGYIGHASHQNGLDVDVYYPRADGRELAPRDAAQIDRRLSQELVDRFLAAGARGDLRGAEHRPAGPPGRVQPLAHHDNHLHVRLESRRRSSSSAPGSNGRRRSSRKKPTGMRADPTAKYALPSSSSSEPASARTT